MPDFQNTQLNSDGAATADGASAISVDVYLKNLDNSPIAGFRPDPIIAAGEGAAIGVCSASDSNGKSTCRVTATVPGLKTFQLRNAKRGLTLSLNFKPPAGVQFASLSAGSITRAKTTDGYTVKMSFGGSVQRGYASTLDGYKIKFSTTGVGAK